MSSDEVHAKDKKDEKDEKDKKDANRFFENRN
jgi:hypothetical protein